MLRCRLLVTPQVLVLGLPATLAIQAKVHTCRALATGRAECTRRRAPSRVPATTPTARTLLGQSRSRLLLTAHPDVQNSHVCIGLRLCETGQDGVFDANQMCNLRYLLLDQRMDNERDSPAIAFLPEGISERVLERLHLLHVRILRHSDRLVVYSGRADQVGVLGSL
jgi:hypothetical protein